jgi:tetratricopeptide (TPR) repeat protein
MYSNRKWISRVALIATAVGGWCAIASGQAQQSVRGVHSHSLMPADEARNIFTSGQSLYDQDRFAEAEKRFREVVTRFPQNPIADRADYYLIRTLTQLGKENEAISRIEAFQRKYPKSSWQGDVQELRMTLTNQVPVNAEVILLRNSTQRTPGPGPRPVTTTTPVAAPRGQPPQPPMPTLPITPPTPPPPFTFELQSSDPEISLQQEILRAMFRVNSDRAIEIATERLKTNPADPVVLSSLNALAMSRSAQALPMLLTIVKTSTNPKARRDAIFWIGQSRGDKDMAVDTLVGLLPGLPDEDAESVTFALSQIRTEKALSALATVARDKGKSEKTRGNALFWIGQSRAPNRVALLDDIYKNNADSSKVRLQTLFALSQTREPQAITVLSNIAANDPDIEVRKQAVFWLGQSRSPEANQALERLLQKK